MHLFIIFQSDLHDISILIVSAGCNASGMVSVG